MTEAQTQDGARVTGTVNVLTNDADPDTTDQPLEVVAASVNAVLTNADGSTETLGTIDFAANGTYTLTLNAAGQLAANALDEGENLSLSADYTTINQDGAEETATLTVSVDGEDDATATITPQNLVLDGSEVLSGVEGTALLGNGASVIFANINIGDPVVTTTGKQLTYLDELLIYSEVSDTEISAVATVNGGPITVFTVNATVTNGVASYDLDLLQPIDPLIFTSTSSDQAFSSSNELIKTQDYGGVTISASAFAGNTEETLNGNAAGLGVQGRGDDSAGSNQSVDSGEMIRFDFANTITAKAVSLTSFTLGIIQTDTGNGNGNNNGTAVNGIWRAYRIVDVAANAQAGDTLIVNGENYTLTQDDIDTGTVAYEVEYGSFYAGQLVIAPGVAFDRVELTTGVGGSFAIESSQNSFILESSAATIDLEAKVDSSSVDFSITFDQLVAGDTTMEAVDPNSLLLAGAGSETLIGLTDAADTFEWNLADGTTDGDTIKNFDATEDVIDLGDLLSGYENGDDLSTFINVSESNGDTVIKVSTVGDLDANGNGTVNQTITVEGVNLMDPDVSMNTLLEQLRTGSIIDPDSVG